MRTCILLYSKNMKLTLKNLLLQIFRDHQNISDTKIQYEQESVFFLNIVYCAMWVNINVWKLEETIIYQLCYVSGFQSFLWWSPAWSSVPQASYQDTESRREPAGSHIQDSCNYYHHPGLNEVSARGACEEVKTNTT